MSGIKEILISNLTKEKGGIWLAQLVQLVTLDLGVMGLSPSLGVGITLKKLKKRER